MPTQGVDSRIVDPVTLQDLPPGEVGELVTRGEQVMSGYWRNAQADAALAVHAPEVRARHALVRLLKPVPAGLSVENLHISGGERVRRVSIEWLGIASTPPAQASAPSAMPSTSVSSTAVTAPTNAAPVNPSLTNHCVAKGEMPKLTKRIATPNEAPEALPSKKGSASGLRKSP